MDQRDVVVAAEHGDDFLRLVLPHQAVVDEDAGELVADRLVDQHRRDRGIDAARQAADDAALADLLADRRDRLLAVGAHGPVALDAGDLVDEILQQPGAVRRVHHLRMEHDAVHLSRRIAEHRKGRAFGSAENLEPLRKRDDPVAVAHPDLVALAGRPQALEQRAVLLDLRRRRGRTRGGRNLRPRRPSARTWSSGRSRCRAPARPLRRRSAGARGLPISVVDAGPPDRITAFGRMRRKAASAYWNGTISE